MLSLLISQSSESLLLSSLTQKRKVHDLVFSVANAQILKEFNQLWNYTFIKEEMRVERKIREDRKTPKDSLPWFLLQKA